MVSYTLFIVFSIVTGLLGLLIGFLLSFMKSQQKLQSLRETFSHHAPYDDTHIRQLFEGVFAKSLQQNSHAYLQQTDLQMKNFLGPLYKELEKLDQQMQRVEHNRTKSYEGVHQSVHHLNNEIKNLYTSTQALHTTTSNLNQALRSNHSTRGKWGEIQLRRIAEMTGMQKHIDFDEQLGSQSSGHIHGQTGRPDMIIRMPQKGIIPVDAKAPMNAYLNAINAQSKEEEKMFLEQHKKAVELHIRALSDKAYWNQFSHAPQLVVLFLPYESGLEAAVSHDPHLLDKALDNKVIIAGPSTLYALLKVISYGWMQTTLAENSEEIYKISKTLFERFSTFYEHFSKIGASLNTAVTKFNDASRSFSSRLVPTLKQIHERSESNQTLVTSEEVYTIDSQAISQESFGDNALPSSQTPPNPQSTSHNEFAERPAERQTEQPAERQAQAEGQTGRPVERPAPQKTKQAFSMESVSHPHI